MARNFHFLLFRFFPQLVLRAELRTLFLIPECTQPAFRLNREELHVPVCFPMRVNFVQQLSDARIVCCRDYLLLSKASRTLDMANRLFWQLSRPAASPKGAPLVCPSTPCLKLIA